MDFQFPKRSKKTSESIKRENKDLYDKQQRMLAELRSIYKFDKKSKKKEPKKEIFGKLFDNEFRPKEKAKKPTCPECLLTPNGTWAHIPLDWLSKMTTIIDLVTKAIHKDDINLLHTIHKSQTGLYKMMSQFVPLKVPEIIIPPKKEHFNVNKKKTFSTDNIKKNISKDAEDDNEEEDEEEDEENDVEDDEEEEEEGEHCYLQKSSGTATYASDCSTTQFGGLLDVLSILPAKTRKLLSQVGTSEGNQVILEADESMSDSLTVMTLINSQSPFESNIPNHSKKHSFSEDDYIPDAKENDSDSLEFNDQFTNLKKPKIKVKDVRRTIIIPKHSYMSKVESHINKELQKEEPKHKIFSQQMRIIRIQRKNEAKNKEKEKLKKIQKPPLNLQKDCLKLFSNRFLKMVPNKEQRIFSCSTISIEDMLVKIRQQMQCRRFRPENEKNTSQRKSKESKINSDDSKHMNEVKGEGLRLSTKFPIQPKHNKPEKEKEPKKRKEPDLQERKIEEKKKYYHRKEKEKDIPVPNNFDLRIQIRNNRNMELCNSKITLKPKTNVEIVNKRITILQEVYKRLGANFRQTIINRIQNIKLK